jgi:hypothetical protein
MTGTEIAPQDQDQNAIVTTNLVIIIKTNLIMKAIPKPILVQ